MSKYKLDQLNLDYVNETTVAQAEVAEQTKNVANELAELNNLIRNYLNFTIKEFMEFPLKDEA
jgi:hypothetical protein